MVGMWNFTSLEFGCTFPKTKGRGSAASACICACEVFAESSEGLKKNKKVKFCFSINALCTQDETDSK